MRATLGLHEYLGEVLPDDPETQQLHARDQEERHDDGRPSRDRAIGQKANTECPDAESDADE